KALIARSLKRLVRPAAKVGILVFKECDLGQAMPEPIAVPGIIVREAELDDRNLFEDTDMFLQRLNEGHRCFIAVEASTGKLANSRWINTSAAYIPELKRYV